MFKFDQRFFLKPSRRTFLSYHFYGVLDVVIFYVARYPTLIVERIIRVARFNVPLIFNIVMNTDVDFNGELDNFIYCINTFDNVFYINISWDLAQKMSSMYIL